MSNQLTPEEIQACTDKLVQARVSLITRPEYAFFTSIIMRMKQEVTRDVNTAGVDGRCFYYNPDFIASLTNKDIVFVMLHEIMHVVMQHITRKGDRDHRLWNIAGDYVINNYLDSLGTHLIPNILLDHQYDNMTADQVYAKLIEYDDKSATPDFDDLMMPNTKEDAEEIANEVDKAIAEGVVAAQQSANEKAYGMLPNDLKLYYEQLTAPQISWQEYVKQFLFGTKAKKETDWRKPSRRGVALNIPLPGKKGKSLARIDFAIDTSGSVSQEMFQQFISEIAHILKKYDPTEVGVMQFDSELKSRDVVKSVKDLETLTFVGGGGTDVTEPLKAFAANNAKACIILTDGYFADAKHLNPHKPVLWAIYDNPKWKPPFGEAVHFELD